MVIHGNEGSEEKEGKEGRKGRKEVFYLMMHLTHFNTVIYGVGHILKEGKKEMFYLTAHSTHFIYGYMASDIW